MKSIAALAFIAFASLTAAETPAPPAAYQNPVLPGFFPDPSLVRVGEDYYLVNSTFQYFPAIIISHSKDLVHWKQIGHVFSDPTSLDLTGFDDGCGIWAPDISYHDGEFYIFYCLVQLKKDRSVNVRGNYVTRSKSITGPWSKPVQLTEEGNDPSHFVDDDGTHYMLYAGGIPKGSATKISKLNADCTKVVDGPHWIDYGGEKRAPEGPHMFKKDGWYYHTMAASGGIYNGHHQLIARSKNVLGPYEASPHNPFIAQMDPKAPIQHHGHAKLVKTQNNEWWALYLCQRRLNGFSTLGRETGLDRVDWQADGWPLINQGKGPSESNTSPKLPFTPQQNLRSDDFAATNIGLPWQWVRNPSPEAFSLTKRPGFLRLHGSTIPVNAERARHILVQREVSHRYTAITRIEFKPRPGDEAGLICYYDSACHIKFALTDKNGPHLQVEECRKGVNKIIAGAGLDSATDTIFLKVEVNGLKRSFSYSSNNKDWTKLTTLDDASFLSDEATPKWGFTGTMVGLFATRPPDSSPISADFDFFHHNPETR